MCGCNADFRRLYFRNRKVGSDGGNSSNKAQAKLKLSVWTRIQAKGHKEDLKVCCGKKTLWPEAGLISLCCNCCCCCCCFQMRRHAQKHTFNNHHPTFDDLQTAEAVAKDNLVCTAGCSLPCTFWRLSFVQPVCASAKGFVHGSCACCRFVYFQFETVRPC